MVWCCLKVGQTRKSDRVMENPTRELTAAELKAIETAVDRVLDRERYTKACLAHINWLVKLEREIMSTRERRYRKIAENRSNKPLTSKADDN